MQQLKENEYIKGQLILPYSRKSCSPL